METEVVKENDAKDYDTIIVGAGPAGATAALYAARYGMKVAFFDTVDPVSQLSLAPKVENYPGFEGSGFELLEKMKNQAMKFGAEYKFEKVMKLKKENGKFVVITENDVYHSLSLIIATGGKHRELGVEGEREFLGRGVSYCATCDGHFFKGKRVIVVGGGSSAVEDAVYLKDLGCDVSLVHRRDELRAEKALQDELFKRNIPVIWNSVVRKIDGGERVERVVLFNRVTNEETVIEVDGVFISVGMRPVTDIVMDLGVERDSAGYIKVDKKQRTNVEGVFAAGDCCDNLLKQIVTACGDGAIAATSAYEYVKMMKG